MKLVDTHIHLYDEKYLDRLDEVLSDARYMGVEAIICVAEDYETSLSTLELASKIDFVYAAIGMHPWTALHSFDELDRVVELIRLENERIIAVGEVGLDKKYESGEKGYSRQIEAFKKMVELAIEFDKPLNIHSRRAARDVLEVLRVYNVEKAHFHWFTDDEDILREVVSMGYYVSFTPSITYSKRNQRLAKIVPLDQLLTETDGPVPFYGELKNVLTEPKHTKLVLTKLSEVHGIDEEELSEIIWRNFNRLYLR